MKQQRWHIDSTAVRINSTPATVIPQQRTIPMKMKACKNANVQTEQNSNEKEERYGETERRGATTVMEAIVVVGAICAMFVHRFGARFYSPHNDRSTFGLDCQP